MPQYNPRDFQRTYNALRSDQTAGIAPVSRFAYILIGKYIDDIAWAQGQVGIPDDATVEEIIGKSTHPKKEDVPLYFDQDKLNTEGITVKQAFDRLYHGVEFQPGTRPMNVIEVCYEPNSPFTMRHYLHSACRYRDEHPDQNLVVFLGTCQSEFRYRYMVENIGEQEFNLEASKIWRPGFEIIDPTKNPEAYFKVVDPALAEYATKVGCTPDGIASTNMAPVINEYIYTNATKNGIVLSPNIDFSPSNLSDCLEMIVAKGDQFTAGPVVHKGFPFGGLNAKEWVPALVATHPHLVLMTTGGADKYRGRELIFYGVSIIGASAPAKKKAIIDALYRQYVLNKSREESWADFIREASIFATEVHIGRILRKRQLEKEAKADADLNVQFEKVEKALSENK